MTKLKDKLTANVRRAKASQQPQSKKPGAERVAAAQPAAKPVVAAKPVPAAPQTTATKKQPVATPTGPAGISESGSTLFPTRVWPD